MKEFPQVDIELKVDEILRPSLERKLTGSTKLDREVDALALPKDLSLTKIAVVILRFYRKVRPIWISNRCVFEPSCSRYSELAIRERGIFKGIFLTLKRLLRCRPGSGGLDISYKKE